MSNSDPRVNDQFLKALSDKQAQVVAMGKRPMWERHLANVIACVAVGVTLGMGGAFFTHAPLQMQKIQQMPERVHWVQMPSSAFLEVSRLPNGSYSLERALVAYHAAGLTPQQATDVVSRLQEISPILMGVADRDLENRFVEQAQITIEDLSKTYPKQEAALSQMIALNQFPLSSSGFMSQLNHPAWIEPSAAWILDGAATIDMVEPGSLKDMSMQEARGALEEAVAGTGLRALRTVPIQWSSPESVFILAKSLVEANNDLIDATGWEGQVLGLGGRVILKMGRPPVRTSAEGIAHAHLNGEVHIQAQWDNLSHEWLHGVEYFSAQIAYHKASLNPLTHQVGGDIADAATVKAFHHAYAQLKDLAPQWQDAREDRVEEVLKIRQGIQRSTTVLRGLGESNATDEATYWLSPTEGLAFSFQAYVGSLNPIALGTQSAGKEAYRLPSEDETRIQSKVWPELFASLSKLNLTIPYQGSQPIHRVDASGFTQRLYRRQSKSTSASSRTSGLPNGSQTTSHLGY